MSVCLHGRVGVICAKLGDARQAVRRAGRVVVGQAVVAAALDVQRGQVEPALARLAEQEVAQAVDDLGVDLLGVRRGGVLQDAVDAGLLDHVRVEEGVGQSDLAIDVRPSCPWSST